MAASSGIWGGIGVHPSPAATAAGGSGGAASSSATISANDFLTLLVTEMQNQDPTAATDPNEYINQLVNVNSLEQLIDINQTLTSVMGGSGSSTPTSSQEQTGISTFEWTDASSKPLSGETALHSTRPSVVQEAAGQDPPSKNIPGNLSIPNAQRAALQIAKSLSGH